MKDRELDRRARVDVCADVLCFVLTVCADNMCFVLAVCCATVTPVWSED